MSTARLILFAAYHDSQRTYVCGKLTGYGKRAARITHISGKVYIVPLNRLRKGTATQASQDAALARERAAKNRRNVANALKEAAIKQTLQASRKRREDAAIEAFRQEMLAKMATKEWQR